MASKFYFSFSVKLLKMRCKQLKNIKFVDTVLGCFDPAKSRFWQ